jgi:hypothetical protein
LTALASLPTLFIQFASYNHPVALPAPTALLWHVSCDSPVGNKIHNGETGMNTELQKNSMFVGNERRTFARFPVTSLELDLLQEQAFKTTCQEISDLYSMLRHKGIQGAQLHEVKTLSRDLGADLGRRTS